MEGYKNIEISYFSEYNKREGGDQMGYILPIVQHSHKNDHYRMIKRTQHPHHIEKSFKVILEDQYQLVNQKYKNHNRGVMQSSRRTPLEKIPHHHDPHKGRLVDEKV